MKIDRKILQSVASDARLKLSKKEEDELLPQLNEILEIFSSLNNLKIEKIKPSFQPIEVKNVLREDSVQKCEEDMLSNTKNKEEGFFKGPKVI